MTNFKFLGAVLVLFVLSLGSISVNAAQRTNIIFDTDMGNDVDDVMAMDLLLKYHEASKISVFNLLVPVIGTVLSGLLLGENVFRIETLVSLLLISGGIVLVNLNVSKKA